MKRTLLITASLFVATAVSVSAQSAREELQVSIIEDTKPVLLGQGQPAPEDSIRSLMEAFVYDQYQSYNEPSIPYFMFMTKDANLAMGVGGAVRARGWFDWRGVTDDPTLAPMTIPMYKDPAHRQGLDGTAAGSAIFFRMIGRHSRIGRYQVFIKGKFKDDGSFKLNKAYATVNDWTVGWATSTFSDGAAETPSINGNGGTLSFDQSALLVRYMHDYNNVRWGASLELPEMNLQTSPMVQARSQYLPNVAAFVQYRWARENHVQLSGIVRFLPYRDLVDLKNRQTAGWGAMFSTVFSPVHALTFYGAFWGGQSYANYGGDMLMDQTDLLLCPDKPGRMYAPWSWGGYASLQYNFTRNIFSTVTYGQLRYDPKKDISVSNYKYGQYVAANLFWQVTPRITVATEFDWVKRRDFDNHTGTGRRLTAMAQFAF